MSVLRHLARRGQLAGSARARLRRPDSAGTDRRGGMPRRLTGLGAGVIAVVALSIATQPVLAQACLPTAAGFPPGRWIAQGITFNNEISDALATTVVSATGGFSLTVADTGAVSGTFTMSGTGYSQSWMANDDSSSEATYVKTGALGGTATLVTVEGDMVVRIGGVIDVDHGSDGAADGNDLYGFGNEFTLPFSTRFSPSAANCSAVFGSLNGPVEYGTETDGDASYFMAVRAGSAPGSVDVQGQLAELLDEAGFVLNMDPLDTDVLRRFVGDMLAFESMLASLEACDPAQELDMGPAWDMLQSVTFNTVRTFLDAAGRGAYTTRDVIDVLGVWLQGGSLGWRAADCLDVNTDLEGALDLFVIFEDVLLDRLGQLSDAPDGDHDAATDRAAIAAAAYQYGLQRVIAALEGR